MTTTPRVIPGVKPRVKDATAYFSQGRLIVLNPLFDDVREMLREATTLPETLSFLRPARNLVYEVNFARSSLRLMEAFHRVRFEQVFQQSLGIDIAPLLRRGPINRYMRKAVSENVDLIRSIPKGMHDSLKKRLIQEFETRPFDRGRLVSLLRREYQVTGSRMRIIARDQTNKLMGNLSQIRQTQAGVKRYKWQTSQDERVRESHGEQNGKFYYWDKAPKDTGHPGQDILCRCVALPVIDDFPEI